MILGIASVMRLAWLVRLHAAARGVAPAPDDFVGWLERLTRENRPWRDELAKARRELRAAIDAPALAEGAAR